MTKHPMLSQSQIQPFRMHLGDKKIYSQALMPVRGPKGFRKLDYEFVNQINPKEIIDWIIDHNFNAFGLVVKDTDGATIAKTKIGWNPTGRDLVQEFSEICEKKNIVFMLSITNMNDAYKGWQHPETVCVHIKDGKDHKAGDPGIHPEGEMRVDLPEGVSLEEMQKKIPFLTDKIDAKIGASRGARGQGYIPLTAFHCPRSEHIDYMVDLVKEIASNYHVDGILADYIRYHHGYRDFCGCERCRTAFAEQYPSKADKIMKCKEWDEFRMANIVEYGRKFNDAVKSVDEKISTSWFNLPGPRIYSRKLVAQDYSGLTNVMDSVIPMNYPYLAGTADDGKKWGRLGNIMHWYFQKNMAHRFKDYGEDASIYCITNSVECNAEEMLKSCIGYDYGIGIALFKYYGTKEDQWYACKLYGNLLKQQKLGDRPPSKEQIREILRKVYEKYPPKVVPKWYNKELKNLNR
ncbi:MAG: hypothetical protein ACTSWX_07870 [Promethearchaeota archaeon]